MKLNFAKISIPSEMKPPKTGNTKYFEEILELGTIY
jgi:hypothetical protein